MRLTTGAAATLFACAAAISFPIAATAGPASADSVTASQGQLPPEAPADAVAMDLLPSLKSVQGANDEVDLIPYATFRGPKVFVGVNGSPTNFAPGSELQVSIARDGKTLATLPAGVRSNQTLYMDSDAQVWDADLAAGPVFWHQYTVTVSRTDGSAIATAHANMPQPSFSAINVHYEATATDEIVTMDPVDTAHIPEGYVVNVSLVEDLPTGPCYRNFVFRLGADDRIPAYQWQIGDPLAHHSGRLVIGSVGTSDYNTQTNWNV